MIFLILLSSILGVLGEVFFGHLLGKGTIIFTILNNSFFFYLKKYKKLKFIYYYLIKKWYSDRLINQTISLSFLKVCNTYYKKIDKGLLEMFGPTIISYNLQLQQQKSIWQLLKFLI
jgi:hypothetical protein